MRITLMLGLTAILTPPLSAQNHSSLLPPEFMPEGGNAAERRGFELLTQGCEVRYPNVMNLIHNDALTVLRLRQRTGERVATLTLGSDKHVVFGGHGTNIFRYYIDIEAIGLTAEDPDINDPANVPEWRTTGCMILAHELWEYATISHPAAVGVENIIRALHGWPPRAQTCGPVIVNEERVILIGVGRHAEIIVLKGPDDRRVREVRAVPDGAELLLKHCT